MDIPGTADLEGLEDFYSPIHLFYGLSSYSILLLIAGSLTQLSV